MRCDALEGKTVRWRKDGAVLQTKTAGYGTSLLISFAQQSDEGIYTCDIMNNTGKIQASYNITLRVEGRFENLGFYEEEKRVVINLVSIIKKSIVNFVSQYLHCVIDDDEFDNELQSREQFHHEFYLNFQIKF